VLQDGPLLSALSNDISRSTMPLARMLCARPCMKVGGLPLGELPPWCVPDPSLLVSAASGVLLAAASLVEPDVRRPDKLLLKKPMPPAPAPAAAAAAPPAPPAAAAVAPCCLSDCCFCCIPGCCCCRCVSCSAQVSSSMGWCMPSTGRGVLELVGVIRMPDRGDPLGNPLPIAAACSSCGLSTSSRRLVTPSYDASASLGGNWACKSIGWVSDNCVFVRVWVVLGDGA
jgi:hypothetical protein